MSLNLGNNKNNPNDPSGGNAGLDPNGNIIGNQGSTGTGGMGATNPAKTPVTAPVKAQPPHPRNDQEQVFQMLWDCQFCGTTKLLGIDHKHCPNCGAQQNPEWRYFPSEADMKFITDPKYVYAGKDTVCPFCQTPNSANNKFCMQCGGDLVNGIPAKTQADLDTDMSGASGLREDLVLKKFNEEHGIKTATPPKKGLPVSKILIGVLAVVAVIIGLIVFLANSKYDTSVQVAKLSWERNIYTERYTALPGSGWENEVPFDAYARSCSLRQRTYTDTETYQCGYTYSDRGDGSGSRNPKYCTRNVTRYQTENYCSYITNRWLPDRTYSTGGSPTDPIQWANFTPSGGGGIGATRETRREEKLLVDFNDVGKDAKGKTYQYTAPNETAWRSYKVGVTYTVTKNRLEQVLWDTLKLPEPR